MKKRFLSLLLCLCIMAAFIPTTAFAASTGTGASSDMDALTALGIDSSAPEGYDPNSTENPFGKDTVSISPVYELYKVGLSSNTSHEKSYPSTGPLQNGSEREEHNTVYNNSLTSTLYGNDAWNAKTSSDIMAAAAPKKENATGIPVTIRTIRTTIPSVSVLIDYPSAFSGDFWIFTAAGWGKSLLSNLRIVLTKCISV